MTLPVQPRHDLPHDLPEQHGVALAVLDELICGSRSVVLATDNLDLATRHARQLDGLRQARQFILSHVGHASQAPSLAGNADPVSPPLGIGSAPHTALLPPDGAVLGDGGA